MASWVGTLSVRSLPIVVKLESPNINESMLGRMSSIQLDDRLVYVKVQFESVSDSWDDMDAVRENVGERGGGEGGGLDISMGFGCLPGGDVGGGMSMPVALGGVWLWRDDWDGTGLCVVGDIGGGTSNSIVRHDSGEDSGEAWGGIGGLLSWVSGVGL